METYYHASNAENKDSILENGLQPQSSDVDNLVFITTNKEDAETVADVYPTIENGVIFEVEIDENNVFEDPEPHGELDSRAHRGAVPPHKISVAE